MPERRFEGCSLPDLPAAPAQDDLSLRAAQKSAAEAEGIWELFEGHVLDAMSGEELPDDPMDYFPGGDLDVEAGERCSQSLALRLRILTMMQLVDIRYH